MCGLRFHNRRKMYQGTARDTHENVLENEIKPTKRMLFEQGAKNLATDSTWHYVDIICLYCFQTDDRIRRGCIQDLDSEHMNDCLEQSDTCKSCQGRFCNTKVNFQECYYCNGHQHPDCTAISSSIDAVTCKEYNSTCLVGIDRVGFTHRRCSNISKVTRDLNHFPIGFEICEASKCNNQVYPENRLRCYQCSGEDECNFVDLGCSSIPNQSIEPKPCSIWSHQDQCYTYFSKGEYFPAFCKTNI